jgi:hypothetical protein
MRIDLHIHTNASDGQYTPSEVIQIARSRHLDIIAITDHDTTAGIEPALAAARIGLTDMRQPQIIAGIELSAEETYFDAAKGRERELDVHILGYFLDLDAPSFQDRLREFRLDREGRGQRILDKLAELGMPLSWERILEIAEGGSVGRPHIARALIEAGYCENTKEVFDRYLYTGGPAYVARERLTPEGAVALIHEAGGAAVMAHPSLVDNYSAMVERLVAAGLDGVEVVHPQNSEDVRLNLRGLAKRYDLIMTGGSDFHGELVKSDIFMGMVTPPEGCVELLRARAEGYKQRT